MSQERVCGVSRGYGAMARVSWSLLNIMTSYSKFDVAGGRKSRLECSVKEVEACGNM
jgi:hypothetical protein